MFELHKKRELSDNLGNSFTFFKTYGKHFFKIFFVVNGGFLLFFGAFIYLFLKVNFDSVRDANVNNDPFNALLSYFNNNEAVLISMIAVFAVAIIVLSLFNYAYPVLYLKLIGEKNTNDFTINEIMTNFRQSIWKLIKFTIGCVFIIMPILLITLIVLIFLCFIIVGIPLIMISIPAFFSFLNFSFYAYITDDKRFFESLNYAYHLVKEDFWNTIGATFIMMMILQFIQAFITFFFYFVGISIFIVSQIGASGFNNVKPFEPSPLIIIFITAIVLFIMVLSSVFNNILVINQGMIYYSLEAKNRSLNTEIDLIGDSNE